MYEFPRKFLPKQIEVLDSVKDYQFILYSGAFRAGKTLLLAHIVIDVCIENPGVEGVLGSLTTPQLTDVVFAVFLKELELYQNILDKNNISIRLAKKVIRTKGAMRVEFYNGSLVHFKSCEDELKLRGLTLDFVGLDEPIDIDESVYLQYLGRLSGTGNLRTGKPFIVLTTNPGSQNHWIYKHFFINPTVRHKTVETTTYENILLPDYENYIKRLERNYDEDWIRRYLDGKWGAFSGQIYKRFNAEKHAGDFKAYQPGGSRAAEVRYYVCGVDWGITNPSCILAIAILHNKEIIVLEEYYDNNKTSGQVAAAIKKFDNKYHFKKIYIDPSAKDLRIQAEELHTPADKGNNDIQGGIGKIQSLLKNNLFHVDWKCPNLIREMQAYRRAKDKPNQNANENPLPKDDHAPDALRYGLTGYSPYKYPVRMIWGKRLLWDY